VVDLRYEDVDISDAEELGGGNWYTIVGFGLTETRRYLGLFRRNVTYGETLFLLVTSEGVKERPKIEEVTEERFRTRIAQKNLDKEAIVKYIGEKVMEATTKESLTEAYKYLEQFFTVED
jgi:hypothetical protein